MCQRFLNISSIERLFSIFLPPDNSFFSFSPAVKHHPRETLLHVAVRLGLVHLARFLIHQPRGQRVLTLPNQDGDTPLQLAQKSGQHAMFMLLAA